MSKITKMLLLLVVAGLVMTMGFAGPAEAKKMTLRLGSTVPEEGYFEIESHRLFKKTVYELSDGELNVKIFPNCQLGGERDMAEAAVLGELHLIVLSDGMMGNFIPEWKIFALPFLVQNFDTINKLMASPLGELMAESASKHGLRHLFTGISAYRNPINNVRPITRVADYKGLKIRTMENPIQMDTMKALGALPTALPLPEAYSAFQTGVAEGSFGDVAAFALFNWAEVLKYITLAPLFPCLENFYVSQKVWDKMNAKNKLAILKAARLWGEDFNRKGYASELQYIDQLKKKGNVFNTLDPAKYPEFIEACQPVYDKFLKQNPDLKPYVDWLKEN